VSELNKVERDQYVYKQLSTRKQIQTTEIDNIQVFSHEGLKARLDALDQLAKIEPELAELVDLKFFCGFSFAEIGALQKVSERTVQRKWEKARVYLHRHIRADLPL